jgi:hypothetical protein
MFFVNKQKTSANSGERTKYGNLSRVSYQLYINFPPPPTSAWYVRGRRLGLDVPDRQSIAPSTCKGNTHRARYPTLCVYLSFVPSALRPDIQTYQTVKDVLDDYDTLAELLQSVEHFLSRLDIYTKIPPTVSMTEMIIKILVELLSILALATKQLQQGKLSESVLAGISSYLTILRRSACKE